MSTARVHRDLLLTAAPCRRYLFAFARTMTVPARRTQTERAPETDGETRAPCRRTCTLRVIESSPVRRPGAASSIPSAPYIEWALAFRLAHQTEPPLRDLPVRAHVLGAIPPAFDTLLMRLGARARPEAWAGTDLDAASLRLRLPAPEHTRVQRDRRKSVEVHRSLSAACGALRPTASLHPDIHVAARRSLC